jgi:alkylation response protein AidB-like acyl-CoA dehydrogenase
MAHELTATTAPGARLVALAEVLAADLASRAGLHDREGSYPFASIDALRDAGYFAAPIPERHGGLGVESTHDVVVAASRLARGDASVAIGVNMHMAFVLNLARRGRMAEAAGQERRAAAIGAAMAAMARDGAVMAAAVSERGQDLSRPRTTAVRTESGWRIDGDKVFCTMSPAATALYVAVTFTDDDGEERYGYAHVPAGTPGMEVNDDWDALGMRASGSHSVSFRGAEVPAAALRGGFPLGDALPFMERNLNAGLFHASASLGIAESAHAGAVRPLLEGRRDREDARTKMLVAESAIDLSTARAALSRAAALIDAHHAASPAAHGTIEEVTALFTEAQAAKAFVGEASGRVVDRALALSGGAGYLNGSPLARAYRDVRAGAFMHPLGANRAYEFLARHALGMEPSLA